MRIVNIMPISQMGDMLKQPTCMFLTHLVEKYPEYANAARKYSGYKILDNSLIELGQATTLGRVYDAAIRIDASEIILPDVFRDGPATFNKVCDSLTELRILDSSDNRHFQTMAVCQGSTPREFEECFEKLSHLNDLDVIGIPKVCAKMLPEGRPGFEHLWQNCHKKIHLLGIWYSLEELARYKNPSRIRTVDSCLNAYFDAAKLPRTSVRPDGYTIDLETGEITGGKV